MANKLFDPRVMEMAAGSRPPSLFDRLCGWLAIAGGGLLLLAALVTVISVLGRYFLRAPVPGDIEIVGLLVAGAISLFFPLCQLRRGNVIVDVFTENAPPAARRWLDVAASLLIAGVGAVLAWRLALGGIELRQAGDETMVLRLPTWIGFIVVVPSFALLAVAGLVAAWRDLRQGGAQ